MEVVKFTETVFTESGKKGIMTPDSDGYYTMVIGALNSFNSAGEFYTAEGALEIFNNSSNFMRRIKNGALYAELGHPKKLPGMTPSDFYNRVVSIDEKNICAHFSEVSLDFDFGKKNPKLNNPELIGIIGKVKPAGAKANALQLALDNPKQNAAFSIRGLTENKYVRNRVERRLTNIITFDHVSEPGINVADKYMAPSLESKIATEGYRVEELMDTLIDKDVLKAVLSGNMSHIGLESNKEIFKDILHTLDKSKTNRLSGW